MSLNQTPPWIRGGLTREQKRDALAAIYGVPGEMTETEIDELRQRLAEEPTD